MRRKVISFAPCLAGACQSLCGARSSEAPSDQHGSRSRVPDQLQRHLSNSLWSPPASLRKMDLKQTVARRLHHRYTVHLDILGIGRLATLSLAVQDSKGADFGSCAMQAANSMVGEQADGPLNVTKTGATSSGSAQGSLRASHGRTRCQSMSHTTYFLQNELSPTQMCASSTSRRTVLGAESAPSRFKYEFVGDCYRYGLISGEAFAAEEHCGVDRVRLVSTVLSGSEADIRTFSSS
jgi:hypothetical protein